MLNGDETGRWAEGFGVATDAVRFDHLLSHVIRACSPTVADVADTVFYGGTALARTHLDGHRLSLDVDLLARDPDALADRLAEDAEQRLRAFGAGARRQQDEYGNELVLVGSTRTGDVRVQVVQRDDAHDRLVFDTVPVSLRYSDLPPTVVLPVPSAGSFVAMKVAAWRDRREPRDLFDLAALADAGHATDDAVRLVREFTGAPPLRQDFDRDVAPGRWEDSLRGLVVHLPGSRECREAVMDAFGLSAEAGTDDPVPDAGDDRSPGL